MIEVLCSDALVFALLSTDTVLIALAGDDGIQVFSDVAPREVDPIYVVFQTPDITDRIAMGGYRMFSTISYVVQVIGKSKSFGQLKPYYERIDELMEASEWTLSEGAWVGRFVRQSTIKYNDEVDGNVWSFLGGIYDTLVCGA